MMCILNNLSGLLIYGKWILKFQALVLVYFGLALMGYYIGKGLQNFRKSAKEIDYFTLLKESD